MIEDVPLPARDGFALAATHFAPREPTGRVLLIAPATGVKRRIYREVAAYFATWGYDVLTWDWRGVGDSRAPGGSDGITMESWARRDLTGAIDWGSARCADRQLFVMGHSFGGQAVGLAPNADRVRALVTVASQSGYWGHWPSPSRYALALLWYVGMPVLTALAGRFPAAALRLGEDLPAGVARQWARWCRSPDYMVDYSGHQRLTMPILAWSFAGDAFAPEPAVEALHVRYGSARLTRRHVAPDEVGARRIGHFGFFRAGVGRALWDETRHWLDAAAAAGRGP